MIQQRQKNPCDAGTLESEWSVHGVRTEVHTRYLTLKYKTENFQFPPQKPSERQVYFLTF